MSPALNGSSALQRFEHSNAIEIRNGIMFDFYPGLPHLMRSTTEEVNILKTDVSIDLQELPEVIPPPGIPPERQKYLYEQNKNVL